MPRAAVVAVAPAIVHSAREQWLARRAELVTATDAADVICHALGEDYYRAPAEILVAKWERTEAKDSQPMKWGRRMQVLIGDAYAEETGRDVSHVPEYALQDHPSIPWLAASLDAMFRDTRDGKIGPLEIKSDGSRWTEGEPPMRHVVQNQIQAATVEGATGAAVTAFVDRFRPLISRDVAIDPAFFAGCLPILEQFAHYLKTRTLPTDPRAFSKAATKALWSKTNGETIAFDHDDLALVERWQSAKERAAAAEADKTDAEIALAVRLREAYAGALPDGSEYRITRSPIAAQLCPHGSEIRGAYVRVAPSRYWPKHLRRAKGALSSKKTAFIEGNTTT